MSNDRPRSPAGTSFGWLLVMLGVLWMLLTGGCTAVTTVSLLLEKSSEGVAFVPVFVFSGSIVFLPGLAAFLFGRMLLRTRPALDASS